MMLRSINISILLSLLLSLLLSGCVSKTDIYGDENGEGSRVDSITIAYLKSLYRGYALRIDQDVEIRGIVVANDRFGALTNSIFICDQSGGIEVKIAGDELYTYFHTDRRVAVRVHGLTLGDYGGVVSLGAESNNPKYENGTIPNSQMAQYFRVLSGFISVKPKSFMIANLEPSAVSRMIYIEQAQFIDEELGLPWCDPDVNTSRHMVDRNGDTLVVYTDYRSQFAGNSLPAGSGYIEGVLSYFNRRYQLRVVNPKSVIMESPRF